MAFKYVTKYGSPAPRRKGSTLFRACASGRLSFDPTSTVPMFKTSFIWSMLTLGFAVLVFKKKFAPPNWKNANRVQPGAHMCDHAGVTAIGGTPLGEVAIIPSV